MHFRLIYRGELKSSGNNNKRPAEKWEVRRHLHPQLEELWETDYTLQGKGPTIDRSHEESIPKPQTKEELLEFERAMLRKPVIVGSHPFLPLVRKSLSLTCSLDILFLRKDRPGSLISGDLDGRLKTLFDGLRIPKENEMTYGSPAGKPHYCLLEDDSLITDLSVRTDRLLSRPGASTSEVLLVIHVVVRASAVTDDNTAFVFGPGASTS